MPRKPLTTEQEVALSAARAALAAERLAESEALADAQRIVQERIDASRAKTNAALYRARHEHRVNIATITEHVLGNQHRKAITVRLEEHEKRQGITRTKSEDGVVEIIKDPNVATGLRVIVEDDAVRVEMTEFSHPDVGNDLTGWVAYDHIGDLTQASDTLGSWLDNPLNPIRLWSLPEVQEQL